MQLANPDASYWFGAALVMIAALAGYWVWKQRLKRELGHLRMIAAMTDELSARRQIASAVLTILGFALLVFALMQPQWGQTDKIVKRTGVDVVFALDLSNSMLARDVSPDRLQAAKNEISTTLERLAGDRVGLVVFTAVSFAQTPLTTDYGAMRFYLRKLEPGQMPFGGTSVGQAISDSVDLLSGNKEDGDGEKKTRRAKNQVVVLITDGEDHESAPRQAARLAADKGVHIVTVGFGSERGERIPVFDASGRLTGYKRDRQGNIIYSKLDSTSLEKIARETGGIYIPYQGENSVAYALLDYINQLEKSELEAMMKQRYKEQFMWFLFPGLLLICLGLALGDRRRPWRPRIGEGAKPGKIKGLLRSGVVLCAVLSGFGCEGAFERVVPAVAEGNAHVAAGEHEEAVDAYRRAQKVTPTSPELNYNLGTAYAGVEDQEELAQSHLARALESEDPDLRFDALYNMGLDFARRERWQDAHETFKQAIALYAGDPPRAKLAQYHDAVTNLEFVWSKLYPPCQTLEGADEDNDEPGQATSLESLEVADKTLCGLDDDWYAVPVLVGTQIEVHAEFEDLRDTPDPEHVFLPRPEDLQIALFDAAGERVLAVDQGIEASGARLVKTREKGGKTIHHVERHLATLTVTPEMLPGEASTVLLKVKAEDEREFRYSLNITAIPPCSALDDRFEPNESRDQAAKLSPGANQLHLCPGSQDWFALDAELGDTFFVDVQPGEDAEKGQPPALELEVFDQAGDRVEVGTPEAGLLTAGVWEIAEPGRFYVRVAGQDADQQGPYNLDLYQFAPCPLGDDRYEDNDDAQSASMLDPQAPMHRYLRLCPDDADFFRVPLPDQNKEKEEEADKGGKQAPTSAPTKPHEPNYKLALGLALVSNPTENAIPEDERSLSFDLLSESGDQILLEAIAPGPSGEADDRADRDRPTQLGQGDLPEQLEFDRVLQKEKMPSQEALVRVQGTQTFYHIVQLAPPPQEQQSQEQQDEQEQQDQQDQQQGDEQQDKQQNDSESGEDGEEQDERQDGAGDEKSEEEEERDKGEEGDAEEKEDDPEGEEKEEPGEGEDEGDEQGEQEESKGSPGEPERADPEARRIDDMLRALEESDDNFQMRKALENTPGRYIDKDW